MTPDLQRIPKRDDAHRSAWPKAGAEAMLGQSALLAFFKRF